MVAHDEQPDARRLDQAPPVSRVGQDLRLVRERLGWSLEAVAEHLRIRLEFLQGIEDGRTDQLPGPTYVIGFVRAYAKVLGLDQDEVARRFRAEAGDLNRAELTFPAPVPERGIPALAVVAVGAILVVGAYAAWYRMSGNEQPGPDAVQAIPEHLAPLVADRPAPPAAAPATIPAVPESSEPAYSQAPDMPSVPPSSAAAAMAPPPSPPSSEGARIVVRARSETWIQVKDPRGQIVLNKVLQKGETWQVPARPAPASGAGMQTALLLTTGNAGGTELLVDGVTAAPLGLEGVVRRDLPLDAEAIKEGKLAANAPPLFHVSPRNQ